MNSDCPTDDELLALDCNEPGSRRVREHVDQCDACRARRNLLKGQIANLRSPSKDAAETLSPTIVPSGGVAELSIPRAIGRYVVVGGLGSGGQADVYRVIDADLGRHLVLKLSRLPAKDAQSRWDDLMAEGRLLAELDHPGLVRIFDVGIHEGRAYLVLEHVSGRNLEQLFNDRQPTPQEAARVISEIARVVAYAHRRGVIHGDITPRNILVDGVGRARLIDFGLSSIESAWRETTGPTGGTPEFLPPENSPFGDRPKQAGSASDVFGLGATLYWLLTGEAPFAAPTVAASLGRSQRCDIDFEALKRARVPRRLARICIQALAADPTNRPTPGRMADELERASRRWFTRRSVAAAIALPLTCIGLLFWWANFAETDSKEGSTVVQTVPAIEIFSRDGVLTLSNKLPLQTGDRVAFWCDISPGRRATMLWFNAAGEVKAYSPVHEIFEKVDRLFYPARNRSITLTSPEGTDLIFFCRDGQITDDELKADFPAGDRLPQLPARNWLTLRRHEVATEGKLTGISKETLKVEELMKAIEQKLQRHFKGVTAIAFAHYPAETAN